MMKESQKERNRKGKSRMEKFEDKNKIEETPIIKIVESDDEYEDYSITAYQNIGDKGWEKVEIPYRRKKR